MCPMPAEVPALQSVSLARLSTSPALLCLFPVRLDHQRASGGFWRAEGGHIEIWIHCNFYILQTSSQMSFVP